MTQNLSRCDRCGYYMIVEEVATHECKTVMDYKIEGNILWLSDGVNWFPQKLLTAIRNSTTENQQRFTTPDDSTEQLLLHIYSTIA